MLVETFVDNFVGFAFIRSLNDDVILYSNDSYKTIFCNKSSFNELIKDSDSSLIEANLLFCQFVESKFKEKLLPVFAKEIFDTRQYITLRMLVEFNNTPSILTLISECTGDSGELYNEIKVDTSQFYFKETIK
ncbi:hypothetical protein [Aliivibrio fischeri]|uniref:hypothetical protein n=1 Tax=Aliivibrio fischeri TaxID=668 RepID=UPI00069EEEF7|nr:hypothetical protein [Aliivibrio fischeri]